jgi:perosamine synthetase
MDDIVEIAKANNLFVLEDAAEAHLAEYKGNKVGAIGDIGIFSFTPSKPMTTGEGGMITTDDDELAEKCRLIKNFGDVDKFKWDILGFNFRMPEVMGAIGLVQLDKLDDAIKARRNIASAYTAEFEKTDAIVTPFVRHEKDINFQLYTIRLDLARLAVTRDQFADELAQRGVSSRLYYPSLHDQRVFEDICDQNDEEFPHTMEYCESALSLPIFPGLSDEEINQVIESVCDVAEKYRRK